MGDRTCCCCGVTYKTKGNEDTLIYGCRACHHGSWQSNQQELTKIEQNEASFERSYKYGKAVPSK